jgi:hypothetical protein
MNSRRKIILRAASIAVLAMLAVALSNQAFVHHQTAQVSRPAPRGDLPTPEFSSARCETDNHVGTTVGTIAPSSSQKMSDESLAQFIAARIGEWESDDDPALRDERTQQLEAALARSGRTIGERLALIENLPARLMNFAFGLPSFQQWMFSNPEPALEWMCARPGISEARVLSLFQDWSHRDHAAFTNYLEDLPPGAWREQALLLASYASISADPPAAIAFVRQLNPDAQRNALLEMATTEWARREPAAAGRWVEQVRDPELRSPLIGSLLAGYAEIAPELASQWAFQALPPGKILDRTLEEISFASARQPSLDYSSSASPFPASP